MTVVVAMITEEPGAVKSQQEVFRVNERVRDDEATLQPAEGIPKRVSSRLASHQSPYYPTIDRYSHDVDLLEILYCFAN